MFLLLSKTFFSTDVIDLIAKSLKWISALP